MSERKGINNTHLKNQNRGIVLQMISSEQLSRADITKRIGLTKMTVTNIVGELIDDGYIKETETEETSTVGRNPVLLNIASTAPLAVGIYLSRNEICVLVSDLKLQTICLNRHALEKETAETLTDKLFDLMDAVLAFLKTNFRHPRLLGIGISAIGPLDPVSGVILQPTNFFGITNYPIAKLLQERYNMPTFLDNDMNASALAEKLYGKGISFDNFLYLGITNGIGSGIIFNRRLYQDNSASVGEIGHMCINFDGPVCSCGNHGCLEVYANMPVILDKMRHVTKKADISCADFERLCAIHACDEILQDMMKKLSVALVNAVNLLDPQCIIIGHEGAFIPSSYLSMLEKIINSNILAAGYKTVPVIKSSFSHQAPLFGSVSLVFSRLFDGQLFEKKYPDGNQ